MFLPEAVHAYLTTLHGAEPAPLATLRTRTAALAEAHYQLPPEAGQLLRLAVALTGAKRVLDIGTFTGFSALTCALAGGPGTEVDTLDISDRFTDIARPAWIEAGVSSRIHLHLGPALDTLERLAAQRDPRLPYDLAIIDADKETYADYFARVVPMLRPGGLGIADNTLWRGRVIDPGQQGARTRGARRFLESVHSDPRVVALTVPIADGMTLFAKR